MPADTPYCYGNIENVFPLGADGLRHTPESCMVCRVKTECLRTAMQGEEGATVEMERIDRAYEAGMIGFVSRWSRRKALKRKKTAG